MKLKFLLLLLVIFTNQLAFSEEAKPKKKIIKTVTTYEEVEDGSEDAPVKKTVKKQVVQQNNEESAEASSPTSSASASSAHLDLVAGLVLPASDIKDVISIRPGFGAQLLFNISPDFSLGAYYLTNNGSLKDYSNIDFKMNYYGLVTQYKMSPMTYFQFKVGASSLSATGTVSGISITVKSDAHPITVAAGFGAEIPLSSGFAFAPYLGYLHSMKSTSDSSEVDPYGIVEIMAALRFNF